MNFDVIGLHPDNALKIALSIFDNMKSTDCKVKALLNNRPIKCLNTIDLPANFSNGKFIDLNLSEILGIGCVTSYFMWISQQNNTNNTYQAIVGVEDSAKQQIENLLSDGAVWHDQAHVKMLAQQVMTQGFYPEKIITNDDVIAAIKKKNEQRDSYPENCMLIINAFGNQIEIDVSIIYKEIKDLTKSFSDTYLVVYSLPSLSLASVIYFSEPSAPELIIDLKRYSDIDEWRFNQVRRQPTHR